MIESTVKFEEKSIYAIHTLSLHTGVRFLRREPCKEILYSVNIWELIDVKQIDNVTSFEKRKAQSELHKTNAKFKIMTELCKIMTEYGSDKGSGQHNYTIFYTEIFKTQ